MTLKIKKAVKEESKLRLALIGPAGSGKTYSALEIATSLVPGGKILLACSERGSAKKYADIFNFDIVELEDFSPLTYAAFCKLVEAEGYDVGVIDSLSHAWMGKNGALEQVDKRSKGGNSFNAWRDVTPQHNEMVDAILRCNAHIIVTMRTKTEYVIDEVVKNGKKLSVPRKVGLAPVQRDGLDYEFDVVVELDDDNTATISKTRCPALKGQIIEKPGEQVTAVLREWLHGVPAVKPVTKPVTVQPANDTAPAAETDQEPEQESVPMQRFRALSKEIANAKGYAALLDLGARVNAASQHTGIPEAQRKHMKELYTALLDEAQQLEKEAA